MNLHSGRRHRRRRPGGAIASAVLLLTALASLVGQTGPAYAAVQPSPAATSTSQPGAGQSAAAPSTATAAPSAPAEPSAAPADQSPQTAPKVKAAPKVDPKAERDAAAKSIQQADPTGACPASLDPQTVVSCSVEPYKSAALSLTLSQQKDLVLIQVASAQSGVNPKLTAPDGTAVTCESALGAGYGYGAIRCATTQPGTYTLALSNSFGTANAVSVSYLPLLSTTGCRTVAATDLTLGAPTAFHGSLAVGSAGDCYTTGLATGDLLRVSVPNWQVSETVYDGTGKQVCTSNGQSDPSNGLDCRLVGTAPYRVTVYQGSGSAQAYDLTLARLSAPEGCAVVQPQAFGVNPDLSSATRCRTLRVTEAGRYGYASVSSGNAPGGRLFLADGSLASCQSGSCDLTVGDWFWAVDPRYPDAGAFGMQFQSAKETRGCTATADNGLKSGPATGTFGGPGQRLCLTLPTATGNGLYLLNRTPDGGTAVAVEIDDATGAKQCDNGGYTYAVCKLTGTAPFRAVLRGDPAKAFQLVIHRTGDSAGCTAWPQSGFGGSWGAEVSLTQAAQQLCLSLPTGQHSAAEMIDYANIQNRVNAAIHVVDASGTEVCSTLGGSTTTCQLVTNASYTAMLVGVGAVDTYKLVRRDISPTANCTAPASTAVGGASTPFDLASALDARCIRVSGATTDRFWLSSRTLGSRYDPSTVLMAVDADGKIQCRQWGYACKVSGSSSYVVIVVAAGYQGSPIHTDVDTWKVGTSAGWAPECTAHPISVDGFAQRSGVLTESVTGYCAVVDMKPGQSFRVVGTSSATGVEKPRLDVTGSSDWVDGNLTYQCTDNYGEFGARCQATGNAQAGQAVLMLTAPKTARPLEYSMQGVCDFGCNGLPTSISPATGAAGTRTHAVIHGTGLNLGTKVKLVRADAWSSTQPVMAPLSVSADGTSLDVLVDAAGLEPGSYDVVLDGIGYSSGTPSPGYLPKAFTVTAEVVMAPGRFVPVTPSRFLDTRYGIGATQARVGPGGVVTLQVTGVKEVPVSGVSAVVMNVTVVDPAQPSHVTVYPDGRPLPDVSNVNFGAGQTVPNLVTVPVVNGKVDLRNNAGSVDLVADVTGYYTDRAGVGSTLVPITPTRFMDTRYGIGAPQARVGPGGVVTLQVAGVNGVPATGVTAVVMNVTAVDPTDYSHVTVYPDGRPLPGVSNLNFRPGQIVPNLVTVPVVNGKVDLRNNAGSVDLIADVTGYYTDKAGTGSTFSPATPVRLLDTRYGIGARAGAVGTDGLVSIQVSGVEGVPATGVTAVVLNVTVTEPTGVPGSHLTVHPHGTDRPGVSNLNFTPGQTVSNLVVVPVVDGRVTLWNHWGDTQVIADLNGWFAA